MDPESPGAQRHPCLVRVVIPVKDDVQGLRTCLEALAGQRAEHLDIDVVVVDNGSTPPVHAEALSVAPMPVTVLHHPHGGSYAARNAGVVWGRRPHVLAFTDADCVPDPEWLTAGVAALRTHAADGVAGRVEVTFTRTSTRTAAELYEARHAFDQRANVSVHGYGVTANLFVTLAAFERCGGFDPQAPSGGDVLFGRALTSAGGRLVYSEQAIVRHPARSSVRALVKKSVRTTRGAHRLATALGTRPGTAAFTRAQAGRLRRDLVASARGPERLRTTTLGRYVLALVAVRITAVAVFASEERRRLRPRQA